MYAIRSYYECNKNICPTGVATQKAHLVKGLVVADKKHRVANFHRETVEAFNEMSYNFV